MCLSPIYELEGVYVDSDLVCTYFNSSISVINISFKCKLSNGFPSNNLTSKPFSNDLKPKAALN